MEYLNNMLICYIIKVYRIVGLYQQTKPFDVDYNELRRWK